MSGKKYLVVVACLAVLLTLGIQTAAHGTVPMGSGVLIGTYEISYGYNAMAGDLNEVGNPAGPTMYFCGQKTQPLAAANLIPGQYAVRMVPGRETGNPGCEHSGAYYSLPNLWFIILANNPTAIYPNTGYDGGTTDPYKLDPNVWTYGATVWVGTSPTNGARQDGWSFSGLDAVLPIEVKAGEKVWFYTHDWFIDDNIGGTTVELWRITTNKVGMDVKPADVTNTIQLSQQSIIPVAILSSGGFNAPLQVDRTTLHFGRTGMEDSLLRVGRIPVCYSWKVNGDLLPDLVCYFDVHKAAFQVGDRLGILWGRMRNSTPIYALDPVTVVQ